MQYDQSDLIRAYRDVFVLSESGRIILEDLISRFEFLGPGGVDTPQSAFAYVQRKLVIDYILDQITAGELIPAVEMVQNVSKDLAEQGSARR